MIGEWELYIESVSSSLNPYSCRLLNGYCCRGLDSSDGCM
jgi:hypothetical protein